MKHGELLGGFSTRDYNVGNEAEHVKYNVHADPDAVPEASTKALA